MQRWLDVMVLGMIWNVLNCFKRTYRSGSQVAVCRSMFCEKWPLNTVSVCVGSCNPNVWSSDFRWLHICQYSVTQRSFRFAASLIYGNAMSMEQVYLCKLLLNKLCTVTVVLPVKIMSARICRMSDCHYQSTHLSWILFVHRLPVFSVFCLCVVLSYWPVA